MLALGGPADRIDLFTVLTFAPRKELKTYDHTGLLGRRRASGRDNICSDVPK